jgi:hypothetical protein
MGFKPADAVPGAGNVLEEGPYKVSWLDVHSWAIVGHGRFVTWRTGGVGRGGEV